MSTFTRIRLLGLCVVLLAAVVAAGGVRQTAYATTVVRIESEDGQVTQINVPPGSTIEVQAVGQIRSVAPAAHLDKAWLPTGPLNLARFSHTATLLADGTVLVAGGASDAGVTRTSERYDPAAGTWSPTGDLQGPARSGHVAVMLPNGQVLIAGGRTNWGGGQAHAPLDVCELYDPKTGQWSPTGSLATARSATSLTLLNNGKVLAAGGRGPSGGALRSCELYDPATGKWTVTTSMATARWGHAAPRLAGGKVLVFGAFTGAACELYDPASCTWTATGSMTRPRCVYAKLALLDDGRVLAAGGYPYTSSTEVYAPASGTWSRSGELGSSITGGVLARLPGGEVLHIGGAYPDSRGAVATAARYNPANGQWRSVEPASVLRDSHTATRLQSGQVLVVGRLNNAGPIALCQLYNPAAPEPGIALFDGKSLEGWQANPAWKVDRGEIVCPTSKRIKVLSGKYRIHGPFEFTYDIQLLRLRRQDAKGIALRAADGRKLAVVRLDDKPNVFHIRGQTKVAANVPLQTDKWYHVRCRLDADGKFTAWLDGSNKLETTVAVQFPVTLSLECERSGARFANLRLKETALDVQPLSDLAMPQPLAEVTYRGDLVLAKLHNGVKAFANRSYTFQDIPEPLRAMRFIRQNGGDNRPYELHVSRPGAILAATHESNQDARFMQNRGWTLTPWRFRYTGSGRTRLVVWQKHVNVGVEYIPAFRGSWFPIMVITQVDLPSPMASIGYGGNLAVDTLRNGALAYANRRYTFKDVPEKLVGLRFFRQSGGVAQSYELHVTEAGYVLAATTVADKAKQIMRKHGWTLTPWSFRYNDSYNSPLIVWRKRLDVGVTKVPKLAASWAGLIILAARVEAPVGIALGNRGRGRVELAHTRGLIDPNGSFTAEMWVRWPKDKHTQYFMSNKVWPGMSRKLPVEQSCGWVLRTRAAGGLDFTAGVAGAQAWWTAMTDPVSNDGQWQHIAISKTPQIVRIFWNGKLYGSRKLEGVKIIPSPTNMFLGVRAYAHSDRRFDADLRAFRLSGTARYEQDFTPEQTFQKHNDTLILLDFSSGSRTHVPDRSGNGHHGSIVGGQWVYGVPQDEPGHIAGPFIDGSGRYRVVANGDFERGDLGGWAPQVYEGSGSFVAAEPPNAIGMFSAKAVTARHDTSRFGYALRKPVPVVGGRDYILSGFFYAKGLSSGGLYLDLDDVRFERQVHAKLGLDHWQFAWQRITIPPGVTQVTVRAVRDGDIKPNEDAWVDNIALTPVAEFNTPQAVASGGWPSPNEMPRVTAEVELLSGGQFADLSVDHPVWTNARRVWKTLSANLVGKRFLQNPNKHQGVVNFRVVRPSTLVMACTRRWGGGGNASGGWKNQLTTRDQLLAQGWKPVDAELVSHLPSHHEENGMRWEVFERFCQEGETFEYRTEKYAAPILIIEAESRRHAAARRDTDGGGVPVFR